LKIYPKGHLLCVNHKLYEHVGISDGCGHVYENAYRTGGRGKVSLKEFSHGKKIIDIGIVPGSIEPDQIIEKAEVLIADKKRYNLLFNNCEHFVREVCGVDIKTPQIQQAIFSAVSTAVALTAKDSRIKGIATGAAVGSVLSKGKKHAMIQSLIGASFGLLVGMAMHYRKSLKKKENTEKPTP
jgi:hypothetical protein